MHTPSYIHLHVTAHTDCMWTYTHSHIPADIHRYIVRHTSCNSCTPMLWLFPSSTCVSFGSSSHGEHFSHPPKHSQPWYKATCTLLCSWLTTCGLSSTVGSHALEPIRLSWFKASARQGCLLCAALPSTARSLRPVAFLRWSPLGLLLLFCSLFDCSVLLCHGGSFCSVMSLR